MISVLNDKCLPNVSTLAITLTEETIGENHLLHDNFDLVVASSVCGFLEDYKNTLKLIKTLLFKNGLFVQWDWLAPDNDCDFGFTEDSVSAALRNTGMQNISITQPFSMTSSKGIMKVLMAVAKNSATNCSPSEMSESAIFVENGSGFPANAKRSRILSRDFSTSCATAGSGGTVLDFRIST